MSANIRELLSAVSIKKQADIVSLPSDADFICIPKVNAAASSVDYINETDALDIGKGDEWARQVISSNIDASVDFEKYASSEIGAYLAVFGLGSWAETVVGATGAQYMATPLDPVDGGIELPITAYVEKVRSGAATVIDRAIVGCVVQSWSLELTSGPGRQNTKMNFQLVGTGKIAIPSGVVVPAPLVEHPVKPMSFVLGSDDYVALRRFVSLSFEYNNNIRLDQGYFPGSGYDASLYQMRGRLENGDRTITFKTVVRLEAGSTEFTKLMNKTHGRALLTCAGETILGSTPTTANSFVIDAPDSIISAAVIADDSGILTVEIDVTPVKLAGQPIIKVSAMTPLAGIGLDATVRAIQDAA